MFAGLVTFGSVLCIVTLCIALAIVAFALYNGRERGEWCKARDNVKGAEDAHASALRTAFAEMRKLGRVRGANARIAYASYVRGECPSLAIAPWITVSPFMRTNQRATVAMRYSVKRASELLAMARAERERGRYHVARLILSHARAHIQRAEDHRDGHMVA